MPADNKALRRYHAGIERALGLFDATSEWADFIAYLSRLLKALQDAPPEADLPMKSTIARHLAQCLRPSLPSGVHQKALDVYALIFSIIGLTGLAQDLSLYFAGLSHTFTFASLSTRPQLLAIYNDYILELSAGILRPALRAIILSLLPGLEEENGEDFERTLATFNRLRAKYLADGQEEIFWQNLFLASVTASNRRAGVLAYLIKFLPKFLPNHEPISSDHKNGVPSADCIIKPEPGLLVRCFATGLQDDQPLVQRGFLDLLVTHLPLNAHIFHQSKHQNDLDVLVRAAAMVVLRRDMGLNRRLWTWFGGFEAKQSVGTVSAADQSTGVTKTLSYFSQFGLNSLVRGILFMLDAKTNQAAAKAQPFRVALSLMDRWEIGGPVVEAVFVPLIQSLQIYQTNAPSQEAFDEVFRSANVFFDGIEGSLVAKQMLKLLDQGDLDIILFILNNFNLEDEEMINIHIPLITLRVADELYRSLTGEKAPSSDDQLQTSNEKVSQILDELFKLISSDVLVDTISQRNADGIGEWKDQITKFYQPKSSASSSTTEALPKTTLTALLAHNLYETYLRVIQQNDSDLLVLSQLTSSVESYMAMTSGYSTVKRIDFSQRLLSCLEDENVSGKVFDVLSSMTHVVHALWMSDVKHDALDHKMLSCFTPSLTDKLWQFLQPSTPQYHVEASENIWRLHSISSNEKFVESTILTAMSQKPMNKAKHQQDTFRFASLWTHARSAIRHLAAGQPLQTSRSTEEVPDLLRKPLLYLIDSARAIHSDESLLLWIRSLSSATPLFRATLDATTEDLADRQILGVGLERLLQLIAILKSSSNLWQSFCEQSGQAAAVLEFCSLILSKEPLARTLGPRALSVIQLMVKNGQYQLGDDFVSLLTTHFASTTDDIELQGALLETLQSVFSATPAPQQAELLLPVLLDNFASMKTDSQIDKFIALTCSIIPSLSAAILMTNLLKITNLFCKRLDAYFSNLQNLYTKRTDITTDGDRQLQEFFSNPERSISNLLSGIEYILARAHHQASGTEPASASVAAPSIDLTSARSSANDHLTVVLCMQDVLKSCASISLWRAGGRGATGVVDPKSLHYMSSKLRARTRRILENLIEAEPQECLETLMGLWATRHASNAQYSQVLELLQTLDGARPKFMMPATFNAIYNRTNPGALDGSQKSSLSVDVNALQLIAFLNDYTNALEDDLLDEIWTDCMAFLKEILANPMPHRHILLKLLEFVAVLCNKMENTNFGEESRMRKEVADMCARLFTAIFTIKPNGLDGSGSHAVDAEAIFRRTHKLSRGHLESGSALQTFYENLPDLVSCLSHSERLMSVYIGIATNMTGPMLHAKAFPSNVSPELLALLQIMASAPLATRAWKKDVLDAFNDLRFFQNAPELIELGWLPLIKQLTLTDRALMTELQTRLIPPAAAGLMFGVGATAARTEADKKTQLTLRRIILLLLSMETDSFVPQLQTLFLKLQEQLTATVDSSPSSASRNEVYLTFRAILLCFSQSQLSALWPILDTELRELCTDILDPTNSKFNVQTKLQGAKLLDLLLLLKPDEFQLHEWLFVTDTVDAIYPPDGHQSVALADQIGAAAFAHVGDQLEQTKANANVGVGAQEQHGARKPWLCTDDSRDPEKLTALLSNFFSQLSIRAFEGNYGLQRIDLQACKKDLIADLFAEG